MAGALPRTSGILESSLYVSDLDRALAFYQRLFGFELFVHDGRMAALGVPGGQVLLLFQQGATDTPAPAPNGGTIPPHHGSGALHLCFSMPFGELAAWEAHLARETVPIESRVRWPRGGTSLYVRDPDGHSIEIATPGLWPNA
ncbi:MAG TPA: VOC family protein [Acetobacteraceae bacterium]|nr:VOC family protein [Acetobacteraceae bacterium]